MSLPSRYKYLLEPPIPPIMTRVAMGMYGAYEGLGKSNNPLILAWADEVETLCHSAYNDWAADFYNSDSIAWCGLFAAVCAARSSQGRPERFPPKNYLSALAWASFGQPVKKDINNILVGDIMVLVRAGGGHVTQAVGVAKSGTSFFGLGGNQDNAVNIKEFPMSRVYAIRRPPYLDKPEGARHVVLSSTGVFSSSEA